MFGTPPQLIFRPFKSQKDSFRQILELWEQKGFCNVVPYPDRFVFWGIGKPHSISTGVILFDSDQVANGEPFPECEGILFSNELPKSDTLFPRRWAKWTFWPRWPALVESTYWKDSASYTENVSALQNQPRPVRSVFVGKIENPEQKQNRFRYHTQDELSKIITRFHCNEAMWSPTNSYQLFDPPDYCQLLIQSEMGLCLPGYGPKCNREVEYAALGVVPILTQGCDVNYHEPWIENKNYLFAKTDDDIRRIVEDTSQSILSEIRSNNLDWYYRNCHSSNSFRLTKQIIESNFQ